MKIIYLALSAITILLVGCSSTYTIKNFSSKEKFYENFNNSAKNKTVKVTLSNDSSFTALEGTNITNDSLFFTTQILKEEKIESNAIRNIKYLESGSSNLAAIIILNNGKELKAKKADMLEGSSINALIMENKNVNLPLNDIKKVSYKNRLLGTLIGFLIGIPAAYLVGEQFFVLFGSGNEMAISLISSPIIGGIIGAITGYTYIYQFNP
ncbi:MAG: hypothetical protein M1480_15025 [Bacteroidetes bacterium]|nr:hypothetical protein [Bacteroidota bacterium]